MGDGQSNEAETMDISERWAEEQRLAIESLKIAEQAGDGAAIDTFLSVLSVQEEDIIRLRWGFGRPRLRTLREIGETIGLSASRVSQIDHKARRKLSWCLRSIGPVGSPEVERHALETRKRRAAEQREILQQRAAKTAAAERRIEERSRRDELRRAKARVKNWQRQIDRRAADRNGLANTVATLVQRILRIEGRGWLARTILPHQSVLQHLRAKKVALEEAIGETDLALARLRASLLAEVAASAIEASEPGGPPAKSVFK